MGDLVYSYNSYYSGSNHLIEYRLDNDGEVLESIETPIDVQIGADFQQETIHIYRSGCYYAGSKLVILALVNKPCYLRQYIDGVETGNWTNMGSYTNNEGDYTFSGNFRISGQYYPGTESVDFYEGTTNVTINSKIVQKTTLSDYYDWVTNSAPLGGTVVVGYQFPAGGTYEYAKIVFKKDRIPADVNDGYAVDIDPTATSVEVEGISKTLGTKYYFTIFTDKSVSDEFVYEVGKVWDGSETAILWSGNENKLTAKVANSHIVFTFYSGDTVIYTFNSTVGTGVSDTRKINVSFLIDHDFEVAKPSFIYDNGNSTYSYNQETPTDSQMADLYTWVNAGLGG